MNLTGYKPHENQAKIHKDIIEKDYKYYVLNIGRQWGKTLLGINQALFYLVNDKGCNIGWVSPIYKQSKKVFENLKSATVESGLFYYNSSDFEVKINGSLLTFFSGERPDNIRGNTFDYLFIDEAAFQRGELWDEVLQPATLVKGKKIIFISTPNGKNHFYKFSKMHTYHDEWYYAQMPTSSNPFISKLDLESIRLQVPEHVFKQEYLAEFIDDVSSVFGSFRQCINNLKPKGKKRFGGLDIGRADDYTVLDVIDENGNQIFTERWRQMEWANIVDRVAQRILEHKAFTLVEVNNQGDVFFEMLREKCPNLIMPFVTNTNSKPKIIEALAIDFENKNLNLLGKDYQVSELEAFTYVYNNSTRRVKYGAPNGMHDDSVISLAIANECKNKYGKAGSYKVRKVSYKK